MNLDHLNPQQRQGVLTLKGPLLVLAGAGTGKTTLITNRVGWMLKSGIKPENIAALTFTNKAATEMKNRVKKLLANIKPRNLFMGTFHAFGSKVLRKHSSFLGFTGKIGIADEGDQLGLIKQVMDQQGINRNELKPELFMIGIHHAKNHLTPVDKISIPGSQEWCELLRSVYHAYQGQLKSMNLVDFDDLIVLPIKLWQENPEILEGYRGQYRYLLVDEYQDTNFAQAELIRLLAGIEKNICVVGDDDQSIYAWRGAEVANILNFPKHFSGAQTIKLEQNYRSTNTILSVANHLISHNTSRHGKSLWSSGEAGELIKIFEAENEIQEAKIVTDIIQHFRFEKHFNYRDIAILFRSNFQTRIFEQTLRACSIPYQLIGAKAFYERKEVKDALAYLKIIHNKHDDLSLLRILNVPPRGIGERTIDKLKVYKESTGKCYIDILRRDEFHQLLNETVASAIRKFLDCYDRRVKAFDGSCKLAENVKDYLEDVGYLSGLRQIYKDHKEMMTRKENLDEFINSASLLEERRGRKITLQEFLEINTFLDDFDRTTENSPQGNAVTLMTVHSAKGMEFTNVIIVGMEQYLFPHERSIKEKSLEEERRLFYVAVTRAKKNVALTRAKIRTKYNQKIVREKSCFLTELPQDLIVYASEKELQKPADSNQVDSFLEALKEKFT